MIDNENVTSVEEADQVVEELGVNAKEEKLNEEKPVEEEEKVDLYAKSIDDMLKLAQEGKNLDKNDITSNPDAICMYEMLKQIKKDGGVVKFSAYNRMTPSLKKKVLEAANQNGIYTKDEIRIFAKTIVLQMYQDDALDSAWTKLQEDINKANRMPEQMDIFGSVIYDKMIRKALIKDIALKEKDPNYDPNNLFVQTVNRFLDSWFFINTISCISNNKTCLKKAIKNLKRNIENINYIYEKMNIKTSAHTNAQVLFKNIAKKFDSEMAAYYIAAVNELLNTCTEKNIYALQTSFNTSLIMGILSFINEDSEVQTDEGAILYKNFLRFERICKLMQLEVEAPEKALEHNYNSKWLALLIEAEKEKSELYNKERHIAEQEYESKYAKNMKEETIKTTETVDTTTEAVEGTGETDTVESENV